MHDIQSHSSYKRKKNALWNAKGIVAIFSTNYILYRMKDLHGVLDASILVEMVEIAQKIAMENLDSMKSLLKKEEQRQLQFIESVGFRL